MITHACVRYEDDLSQAIVPVDDIKDFKPTGPTDFNDGARYSVKWMNGDNHEDEEYYKARILLLGVSREDVQAKISKQRMRIKKVWHSETSEEEDLVEETGKQEKKRMKEKQETATRSDLLKLLEAKKKKMKKNSELKRQPRDFSPEVMAQMSQEPKRRRVEEEEIIASLKRQVAEKDHELRQVRKLNMRLQEQLLKVHIAEDKENKLEKCRPAGIPFPSQQTLTKVPKDRPHGDGPLPSLDKTSPNDCQKEARLDAVAEERMVNLGQGICITEAAWQAISRTGKSTIFVKELAVALYGSKELMERSAKGRHSPKFPNQPKKRPISPHKLAVIQDCYRQRLQEMGMPAQMAREAAAKNVTGLINEKIGDLRRQARREKAAIESAEGRTPVAAATESDY